MFVQEITQITEGHCIGCWKHAVKVDADVTFTTPYIPVKPGEGIFWTRTICPDDSKR